MLSLSRAKKAKGSCGGPALFGLPITAKLLTLSGTGDSQRDSRESILGGFQRGGVL